MHHPDDNGRNWAEWRRDSDRDSRSRMGMGGREWEDDDRHRRDDRSYGRGGQFEERRFHQGRGEDWRHGDFDRDRWQGDRSFGGGGYGDRGYGGGGGYGGYGGGYGGNYGNYGDHGMGERGFGDRGIDRNYGDRSFGDRSFGERGFDRNYGGGGGFFDRGFGGDRYGDRGFGGYGGGQERGFGGGGFGDRQYGAYGGSSVGDWGSFQGDRDRMNANRRFFDDAGYGYGAGGTAGYGGDQWQGNRGWDDRRMYEGGARGERFGMGGGGEGLLGREGRGLHIGKGPKGYRRSDDRIREEICDALTRDPHVDPSEVEVQVKNGEVTLTGQIEDRQQKRWVETIVERIEGVHDVNNQLRVQQGLLGSLFGGNQQQQQQGQQQGGNVGEGRTTTTGRGTQTSDRPNQ